MLQTNLATLLLKKRLTLPLTALFFVNSLLADEIKNTQDISAKTKLVPNSVKALVSNDHKKLQNWLKRKSNTLELI